MRIAIAHPENVAQIRSLIELGAEYEIAWTSEDGLETVSHCVMDPPDLLLMNLIMPGIDGVEVTRRVMTHAPCAILLMANSVQTNAAQIFEAMGYGAKDVILQPLSGYGEIAEATRHALFKKLRTLYRLTLQVPTAAPKITDATAPTNALKYLSAPCNLIVIGSSTGGPGALSVVLSDLPENLSAALVIVQHLDKEFSFDLALWLNAQTRLPVQLAHQNGFPQPGKVYVASSNDHLILDSQGCFAYTPQPRTTHYRPSVDVFFDSVAAHWRTPGLAILLTGMGRDGAKGLANLRQAGWHTIAQNEASCAVYGMPKAAKEINAAVEILPLPQIAERIMRRC